MFFFSFPTQNHSLRVGCEKVSTGNRRPGIFLRARGHYQSRWQRQETRIQGDGNPYAVQGM